MNFDKKQDEKDVRFCANCLTYKPLSIYSHSPFTICDDCHNTSAEVHEIIDDQYFDDHCAREALEDRANVERVYEIWNGMNGFVESCETDDPEQAIKHLSQSIIDDNNEDYILRLRIKGEGYREVNL